MLPSSRQTSSWKDVPGSSQGQVEALALTGEVLVELSLQSVEDRAGTVFYLGGETLTHAL